MPHDGTHDGTTASTPVKLRDVVRVVEGVRTLEGEGFQVRRPFPTQALDHLDPFLLLDEMGPMDLAPGEAKGAPDHPHRGFETVTYLLAGAFEHEDSAGRRGKLSPGDVQWMTAGAGVIHSEMPAHEIRRDGGRVHGFQLWVNLPARDKLMAPRYQELPAARIPTATSPDGAVWVRVIAGEALGVKAAIETRTPIAYLHYKLKPGARHEQTLPDGWNAFAYVVRGQGWFGPLPRAADEGNMVIFGRGGNTVAFGAPKTATEDLEVLVLGGQPLDEPVVRHGPFVMNTREEIAQAFADYRGGRFGEIAR